MDDKTVTTSGSWAVRPVFISSTFKDMHAERDYLRHHVFPRLEEELRKRRHHLEPIDLRVGVETAEAGSEEARELLVLKVCLDEIKRSRPYLIVVLGDRYGWVPPEERMVAAVEEAGFQIDARGHSVTALEIEYGVLKEDPDQRRRSFFYFREPLPYAEMAPEIAAEYSDAFSPSAAIRAYHDQREKLKAKLESDPELKPRVHHYQAQWDNTRHVTGLEAWGEMVFQHLWNDLQEETAEFIGQPSPTWQQVERDALAEFVEHRTRIFVGREDVIDRLLGLARSPTEEKASWGACVTGVPGSGKSALLAHLIRKLEQDRSVLLLANAAGISARSSSVDGMLRRWIQKLAEFLQITEPLPDNATTDDIEKTFASLLGQASVKQRVVVLIDALDQFEPTVRAKRMTWRPKLWPPNARLIATTIPGEQAEEFSQWFGVEEVEVPPLTAKDAEQIATRVWARYHRQLNQDVFRALLELRLPDDNVAAGNPLWLTLASEQLNLLDADDFARAEKEFTGTPVQRLQALMLDTAGRMPADVEGLFGWLLTQTEKVHGEHWTRGMASAIALSRFGWRERDLPDLVPRLAKFLYPDRAIDDFNPLQLAALRRAFRGQLVIRGAEEQLDFFHSQIRRTVHQRYLNDESQRQKLHAQISDYLEVLPESDPIIRVERMRHLIGEKNGLRAARHYAGLKTAHITALEERIGPDWTLVDYILAGGATSIETQSPHSNSNLQWVLSWLEEDQLTAEEVHRLANNFQFNLFERLANDVGLAMQLLLIQTVEQRLIRLAASDASNAWWQGDLSVSHIKVGDVRSAQGDLAGAQRSYEASMAISERLAAAEPSWQRDLSVSHEKVGDVRSAQGDLAGAQRSYEASMAISERLAAADPTNAERQDDLSVSHKKVGDVRSAQGDLAGAQRSYEALMAISERLVASDPTNARWQRNLSASHNNVGDVRSAQGDLAGAHRSYEAMLAISERLVASDPTNAGWQRDLSVSHNRMGDVRRAQGDLAGAQRSYEASMAISERLAASDGSNAWWQGDLSVSHNNVGDMRRAQGDLAGAQRSYEASMAISERLAAADPTNIGWQRDLSVSHNNVGDMRRAQGDFAGAHRSCEASMAIRERLAVSDPTNAGWQRDLSVSHDNVGDMRRAQGDFAGAQRSYEASMAISERLAVSDPTNAGWQRDLSVSHNNVGDMRRAQGDFAGAQRSYEASMAISERLAVSDPTNAGWQRDLSVSHNNVGDVRSAQGDLAGAHRSYEAMLAISERLTASDPTNAGWQRDLSVSHNRMGDVRRAQGDLAGAQRSYEASMAISERLAASDGSNAWWQGDLSVSHNNVGDMRRAQGDLAGAQRSYEASMAISERLAAADPTNIGWQRNLSVSHNNVGDVRSAQGDLAGAQRSYEASLAISERLAAADPTIAGLQRALWVSYWRIANISESLGNSEALNWWRKAYDTLSGIKQRGLFLSPQDEEVLKQLEKKIASQSSRLTPSSTQPESYRLYRPHPGEDADLAAKKNIEYREALKQWQALPWLERVRTTKPEPPT